MILDLSLQYTLLEGGHIGACLQCCRHSPGHYNVLLASLKRVCTGEILPSAKKQALRLLAY